MALPAHPPSSLRTRWLIAAAIVALLFTLQSLRRVGSGPWGVDGSYYMQVARHVAAGNGLLTSVELYHQGLETLPAPTNIYPVWPLLLGSSARLIPLATAATVVPRLLSIAALLLLYWLTSRVFPGRPSDLLPIDYGHIAVLLLGLNISFFSSGCYPYTEPLAFVLTFGALLLLDGASSSGRASLFAASGAAAALAFMTRSQMLLLAPAIAIALLIGLRRRTVTLRACASWVAGCMLPLAIWIAHLATRFAPFSLRDLVAMRSGTAGIPPVEHHVATSGALDYVLDRLAGFLVMFNPFSTMSFVNTFGPAAMLVPVALVVWIMRRRASPPETQVRTPAIQAIVFSGLFMSLVLLHTHNRFFIEWLFGYRHGLPFILLLVPSVAFLMGHGGRVLRAVAALCVAASVLMGAVRAAAFVTVTPEEWPSQGETDLARWLEANDPEAILLTTNAQAMAVASNANFRWTACSQSPETTRRLLTLVRTDYVMVYEGELRCSFAAGLPDLLTQVQQFGVEPERIVLLENAARRYPR